MLFSPHTVDGVVVPMLPLPLPPDSLLFIAESARQDPIVEMVSYAVSCVGSTCIFDIFGAGFHGMCRVIIAANLLRTDPPDGPYSSISVGLPG